MNGQNFTLCPVSEFYKRILLPVTYSVVFVLGLVLNGALLWSVCERTKRWSRSVIYLTNLAVADLLYVLALPLLIISYAYNSAWPFGDFTCRAVRYFFYANLHGSMMFLMCISAHRFLGVCYPMTAFRFRTNNFAVFVSVSVWVLVTAEIAPTLVYSHTGSINNMTVCFDMTSPGNFKQYFPYGIFLALVGFLIPFLVILFCYCSVMRVLCDRPGEGSTRVRTKMRRKSLRVILAVCLMFVLCFVPYHIAQTAYMFVRVYMSADCRVLNVAMISYKVWKTLVSINCCVNPLFYFLAPSRQRREIWDRLRRRHRKIQPGVCLVEVAGRPDHRVATFNTER
ncbi:P2Y purinoceptor 3-like [Osmerus mordax]|uniref:P2Y purinoceptor 3-like n=1 Tax=Osmerus mordax TaxID=8014 RepID=UPI00350ED8BD